MEKNIKRSYPSFLSGNFDLVLILILVLVLGYFSLNTGVYDIKNTSDGRHMFYVIRVPRTVSLMLTGMALSISGLVMQLITQNKLVEPTTTGTIEWAGLGLIVSHLLFISPSLFQRMTFSIIFSFLGTFIFFIILKNIKLKESIIVPIVGIMLGAIISALQTFLSLEFNLSQSIESWFIGSFSSVQIGRYEYLFIILLIVIIIFPLANTLTIVGLGEDLSKSVGVNYNLMVIIATGLIAALVGIVSSVIGNLPFLGLIVPNMVSLYRGDNLKSNLPYVSLFGMALITLCDIISRVIIAPFEVPVSLILGIFGAIIFIVLILKRRVR